MIAEAKAIKAQLEAEETVVEFVEKVGPDGRTFGSITNKKIAEELQKQFGIKIDKRHIQVQAPIRAVGLIDVPVKIYQDITSRNQSSCERRVNLHFLDKIVKGREV